MNKFWSTVAKVLPVPDEIRALTLNLNGGNYLVDTPGVTGESMSLGKSLAISAFYAAVTQIAGDIGRAPLYAYRKEGEELIREEGHLVERLFNESIHPFYDGFQIKEDLVLNLLGGGNGYSRINKLGLEPISLTPLKNHSVYFSTGARNYADWYYRVTYFDRSRTERVNQQDMLHVRNITRDGIRGLSPIQVHKDTLGRIRLQERVTALSYKNWGRPNGFLVTGETLNSEQRQSIQDGWYKQTGGDNVGRVPVLEGGLDFVPIPLSLEDAQYIAASEHGIRDVARIFHISPTKLADLERSTYSNTEQLAIDYVENTLEPWGARIERAIEHQILRPLGDMSVVKFDFTDHLNGDILTRSQAWSAALAGKSWMLVNEVRAKESLPALTPEQMEELQPTMMQDNNQPGGEEETDNGQV